jgi:uncharacterized protein (DUF58 family)
VQIYILPTWLCVVFNSLVLGVLLLGFNSQNPFMVGASFLALFIELLSMVESHVNLRELKMSIVSVNSAEEGSHGMIEIQIRSRPSSYGLQIKALESRSRTEKARFYFFNKSLYRLVLAELADVLWGEWKRRRQLPDEFISTTIDGKPVSLKFMTEQRGVHQLPQIKVSSQFPLGMFRAVRLFEFPDKQYASFPKAMGVAFDSKSQSQNVAPHTRQGRRTTTGQSDLEFSHHKEYVLGDNPQRIDWRVSSRQRKKFVRTFTSSSHDEVWVLRWSDTPPHDVERRLQQLAFWAFEARLRRKKFSLVLPSMEVGAGNGEQHLERCLWLLAAFNIDPILSEGTA